MVQATVFKSNTSQAVRLPKAVECPEGVKKVDVVAVGNKRIITPAGSLWDEWFDMLDVEGGLHPANHQLENLPLSRTK